MGVISVTRRWEVKKNLVSIMNSRVNAQWGKFSSSQLYAWQEDCLNGEKKRLEEGLRLKHHKIPYYVIEYFNGYCDSIRNRIDREETCFVYKIFNKNYGCFERDPFPRYDTLPREIWTHPDFGCLGRVIWKSTEFVYFGANTNDDLPKFPAMCFYEKNKVIFFSILQEKDTPESGTSGSFPLSQFNKYEEIMRIAKNYNVSIINMEEI